MAHGLQLFVNLSEDVGWCEYFLQLESVDFKFDFVFACIWIEETFKHLLLFTEFLLKFFLFRFQKLILLLYSIIALVELARLFLKVFKLFLETRLYLFDIGRKLFLLQIQHAFEVIVLALESLDYVFIHLEAFLEHLDFFIALGSVSLVLFAYHLDFTLDLLFVFGELGESFLEFVDLVALEDQFLVFFFDGYWLLYEVVAQGLLLAGLLSEHDQEAVDVDHLGRVWAIGIHWLL